MRRQTALLMGVIGVIAAAVSPAAAVELITNGNFETGTFAGWTTNFQNGGAYLVDQNGSPTNLSGHATVSNPQGATWYAVSDQTGSSAQVLLQNFIVPNGVSNITLSFQMFVNDYDAGPVFGAANFNPNAGANQHARVDILAASVGDFATTTGVIQTFYMGVDGGPDPHAFTSYVFPNLALAAGGYRLRFGNVQTNFFMNVGVDNVSITATVPAPASMLLLALGGTVAVVGTAARQRRFR